MDEHNRLEALVDRYLDQVIEPAELAELDEAVQSSPRARELFWDHALWNAALRAWGERSWGEAAAVPGRLAGWRDLGASFRRWARLVVAVAVTVLGLWIGFSAVHSLWSGGMQPARGADVAVVTASRGARWQGRRVTLGESFGPQRMVLEAGDVTLGLSSGADVVVSGPADFAVRSGLRLQLAAGGVAARVPPAAEGFIVDTPAVDVLDLGTAFGVRAEKDGAVDVMVYAGSVETRTGESRETRTEVLTADMSRRYLPGGRVGELPAGGGAFPSPPVVASDRPVTDGAVRLVDGVPPGFANLESNEFMLLFREATRVSVAAGVPLDIADPGIYASQAAVRGRRLARREVVDSYLLHFKARSEVAGKDAERIILDGSVTFPRPIVGVVCLDSTLRVSDRILSTTAACSSDGFWGVEFDIDDHLVLSTDRRTLWVSLRVDSYVDHIRVFVQPVGPGAP